MKTTNMGNSELLTVYVAIDLNADLPNIDTGICSFLCIEYPRRIEICGLEQWPTTSSSEVHRLVLNHVQKLRAQAAFAKSRIVIVAEAGNAGETSLLGRRLVRDADVHVMMETDQCIGIRITGDSFRHGVSLLGRCRIRDIEFHNPLVRCQALHSPVCASCQSDAKTMEWHFDVRLTSFVSNFRKRRSLLHRTEYTGQSTAGPREKYEYLAVFSALAIGLYAVDPYNGKKFYYLKPAS